MVALQLPCCLRRFLSPLSVLGYKACMMTGSFPFTFSNFTNIKPLPKDGNWATSGRDGGREPIHTHSTIYVIKLFFCVCVPAQNYLPAENREEKNYVVPRASRFRGWKGWDSNLSRAANRWLGRLLCHRGRHDQKDRDNDLLFKPPPL